MSKPLSKILVELHSDKSTYEEAEQKIKDVFANLAMAQLFGCDGYEKSEDSIKCQWCGETEFSPNHNRARLIEKIEAL